MADPNLVRLQHSWDAFGRDDPLYAVLSSMAGGHDLETFMAGGHAEVATVFEKAELFGFGGPPWRRALDFGCGVGRVTQAIADHAQEVVGVDIAPSMIELADRLNRHGEQCRYELNEAADLTRFADDSFDLIFCKLVLQHMATGLARRYLGEFVRVLAPGGLAVFQLPSRFVGRTPLPEGSHRAEISVVRAPTAVRSGDEVVVVARVVNRSEVGWPAGNHAAVAVGGWWADPRGRRDPGPEARWYLPADVVPGAEVEAELRVPAPEGGGTWVLVVDLVQEGVCWFADRGSSVARVPIAVRAPLGARARRAGTTLVAPARRAVAKVVPDLVRQAVRRRHGDAGAPVMEMHGIPRREVEVLLAAHGATIVGVEPDLAAPEWESFTYWVTKASPTLPQ